MHTVHGHDMSDAYEVNRAKAQQKGMAKRLASPWSEQDARRLSYHPGSLGAPRMGTNHPRNRDADRADAKLMLDMMRSERCPAEKDPSIRAAYRELAAGC